MFTKDQNFFRNCKLEWLCEIRPVYIMIILDINISISIQVWLSELFSYLSFIFRGTCRSRCGPGAPSSDELRAARCDQPALPARPPSVRRHAPSRMHVLRCSIPLSRDRESRLLSVVTGQCIVGPTCEWWITSDIVIGADGTAAPSGLYARAPLAPDAPPCAPKRCCWPS